MAEFGEQLRKAREEKGMTQQSLAEKVYVTRQTVSRWEGGERYPDLVTVKKLAQVLGVDAGFLLSDDETQHIVERNPVVEKTAVNNVTLVLFAGIVISYIISVVGVLIRIPSMSSVTASDVWVFGSNAISELIGIAAFVAGFVWILKGAFSPKKVGAVVMAFFASVCIKGLAIFTTGAEIANWFVAVIPVVIGVIGVVTSYFYFWKKQPAAIWYWLVMIVSALGIIRALYTLATTVAFAAQFVSAETALNAVLSICIYVLFCYQAYVLCVRRKMANEIASEKTGGDFMSLTVSGLSKKYHNKTANRDVSFEIGKGINGLLGANGAGKTTLMRMICGVVKPDSGSISLDGIEVGDSEYLKGIGYLPQDFGYYPNFTAKEYLEYMATIKGIDNPECQISDILKKVSLDDVATKKVKTFSGGMKQRLGIAQAILGSPKLLVLDEPTSGLDPKERVKFREILKSVSKDCIVLLSTHIVSDLESMADYIIMVQDGSVVYADTWDKSRNDLETVYMQKLMEVE